MSLSHSESESMAQSELVEEIADLSETVESVRERVSEDFATASKDRAQIRGSISDLQERVEELESENERLRQRLDDGDTKQGKVARVVDYALNKRSGGEAAVKLTPKEIKGATGVSRRYAYDLVDDLPEQYDWFLSPEEMQQYGSIELDLSSQQKCVGIDFEGVHSEGCPVNKFTTDREGEGVE